jgi:hypothetical protein
MTPAYEAKKDEAVKAVSENVAAAVDANIPANWTKIRQRFIPTSNLKSFGGSMI